MFGFFKKKLKVSVINFDVIGVDMHSHVLPGIDDGADTVQDSIILIREMMDAGIKKIIATPHVMYDYYRNTPQTVNEALEILRTELQEQGIQIPVEAAAEYFFDEHFIKHVDDGDSFLTLPDNYILMEFGFMSAPPSFINTLQKLKGDGYKPILAHPERYSYYEIEEIRNLRDWGFLLQLNTISLTGYYGKETKRIAELMVDEDMVDFISSDMHHVKHAEAFAQSLRLPYVQKLLKSGNLKNNLLL